MCVPGLSGGGGARPTEAQRTAAAGPVPTVPGISNAAVVNFRQDVLANFTKQRADAALVSARRDLTPENFDLVFPELATKKDSPPPPAPTPARITPPALPRPLPPPPTPGNPKVADARQRQRQRSTATSRRRLIVGGKRSTKVNSLGTLVTSKKADLSPLNTEKKSLFGS